MVIYAVAVRLSAFLLKVSWGLYMRYYEHMGFPKGKITVQKVLNCFRTTGWVFLSQSKKKCVFIPIVCG